MEIKEQFLQYLETERRLSIKTVETYFESLKLFEEFLSSMSDPRVLGTADGDNIRDWMEQLMEQGRSAAYVNRSLAALRTFYKFCYARGIVSVDPAHSVIGPKKAKRLPQFVKDKDMERLVDELDDSVENADGENTLEKQRIRAIMQVFYHTGLRAAELISLDDSMIDFVNSELKVTGKRNKQRIVPFGVELHMLLKEYIAVRDAKVKRNDDALFVNDKGARMSYSKVRSIVKEQLGALTGLSKCTPHVLRHTFATTMLNHDANLESIKKLLGHQSLTTTEVYVHTTFEQLKKIYNDAHPRK